MDINHEEVLVPMPLEGEDLGVELVRLNHAGLIGLPRLAEAYLDAHHRLAGTRDTDHAFRRSYRGAVYGYGLSMGRVHGPWTELRDTIQNILGNMAANVWYAGDVIRQIADAYATADTEAGEKLQAEWENRPVDSNDPKDHPVDLDPMPLR